MYLEPKVFFDRLRYSVDESVGKIDINLKRTGTDLSKPSSVFVRSRQTDPISARGKNHTPPKKGTDKQLCTPQKHWIRIKFIGNNLFVIFYCSLFNKTNIFSHFSF